MGINVDGKQADGEKCMIEQADGEKCMIERFISCCLHQKLPG
jgi:hypothetical protein